jgi:streptogramin lyase
LNACGWIRIASILRVVTSTPQTNWRVLAEAPAPFRLAADGDGNVFVTAERQVWKIGPDGKPTVFASSDDLAEVSDLAFDRDRNLLVLDALNQNVRRIDARGNITTIATGFDVPSGIAVDADGNVFVSEQYENRIRKVDRAGNVTMFATKLLAPGALAFGPDGTLFVAEEARIRRVDPTGKVSALELKAGVRPKTFKVACVAVDGEGNVFASSKNVVRRIDAAGGVTTLQGPNNRKADYVALALDGRGALYVSDYANNLVYALVL